MKCGLDLAAHADARTSIAAKETEVSSPHKASFVCYLLTGIVLAGFGVRYFFAAELTPYHAAALGQSLAAMPSNQQVTFVTLYRAVGTGMLSTAVAFGFLLFVPFRRGEVWARWAMTAAGLCFAGLSIYFTLAFKAATGIDAPWPAAVASAVLIVVAHVLASWKAKV
jgi:hypothetical protein